METLQKLIDAGAAYPCFCTKEELDAKRERAEKAKALVENLEASLKNLG